MITVMVMRDDAIRWALVLHCQLRCVGSNDPYGLHQMSDSLQWLGPNMHAACNVGGRSSAVVPLGFELWQSMNLTDLVELVTLL